MHAGPHHCVRTRWEGPTGAGGRRFVACDMTPGGGEGGGGCSTTLQ